KKTLGLDLIGRNAVSARLVFTEEQLDAYGTFELQTLEQVLRLGNRDAMTTVADTIRTKISHWDNATDAEFLNTYYEALRARLERKLLFGRRRRDKFDR
ncbi:MAG TPA: RDD family protein, partial [Allosphingosinicella sp.]|nr:RDD family protein [Allosphingosinicella sp.]